MRRQIARMVRFAAGTVACAFSAACVGSDVAGPLQVGDQPLALSFDEFSRQAAQDGDAARASQLAYAALAVRNGIAPTRLELRNAGQVQVFDAFVNDLEWSVSSAPSPFKSVVAWRNLDASNVALLTISATADSADITNPLGPGATIQVLSDVRVMYRETPLSRAASASSGVAWVATQGYVKLLRAGLGAVCPAFTERTNQRGVACRSATYTAQFSVQLAPLELRPFSVTTNVGSREMATPREQSVTGALLTLACTTVNSVTGCL